VVTKKQRRRQLAQASAQRRADRLAARATRRRRLRLVAATLVVLVAVSGLVAWIVVHDRDRESTAAPGITVTSATLPAVPTPIEVTR
jgi:hypothetical protein